MQRVAQTFYIPTEKVSNDTPSIIGLAYWKGIMGNIFSTLYTVMFEDSAMSVKYTSTNFGLF